MFRNFVITGGLNANPAKVSMSLDPVKLDEKMGIAVKSIAYGELQNINASNNSVLLKFDTVKMYQAKMAGEYNGPIMGNTVPFTVHPSHYGRALDVVQSMANTINSALASSLFQEQLTLKVESSIITVTPPKFCTIEPSPLLSFLGAVEKDGVWEIRNEKLVNRQIMGCLYLNIVENSFINGKKSRILCMCPFDYQPGYAFFEFKNPTYVPVEVREFSDITLSILDFHGQFVPFSDKFDTVITLEMRPLHYK